MRAATLRAICGGGRYDNLLQRSAAWTFPRSASAWATWCWASCSGTGAWLPPDGVEHRRLLAAITEDDLPHVLGLAHELRDAGLRVEYALGPQAVGKQLKLADARKRPAARSWSGPTTGPGAR